RVAHVVQAVEAGHQVVGTAVEGLRRCDIEADLTAQARLGGPLASLDDRALVVVRSGEPRVREGAGHQRRGRAVTAPDVGDLRAAGELGLRTVKGRDPAGHQVGSVPGPEEALAAREHLLVVLVPADSGPGAERLDDLLLRPQRA